MTEEELRMESRIESEVFTRLHFLLDYVKREVTNELDETISSYSGLNSSATNDTIRTKVRVYSSYLNNLEKVLDKRIIDYRYHDEEFEEKIHEEKRKFKNKVVDIIVPISQRGNRDYHEKVKIASKLAELLETELLKSYFEGIMTQITLNPSVHHLPIYSKSDKYINQLDYIPKIEGYKKVNAEQNDTETFYTAIGRRMSDRYAGWFTAWKALAEACDKDKTLFPKLCALSDKLNNK